MSKKKATTENAVELTPEEEELVRAAARLPSIRTFRTDSLAEFQIRADGDGRTVEAYAVPFDEPAEVVDIEGHYFEEFHRGAFGRQIARSGAAGIIVLYNHGRDLSMRPSDRFAVPIGKPVEIREDGRGLFTATRYASTKLGDEILQLVEEDILTHMSVQFQRTPGGKGTKRIRGGHKPSGLDLVQRLDVNVVEYGPTPIPSYAGAQVVGVRAGQLATQIHDLSPDERKELSELLRADPLSSPVEGDESKHDPKDPTPDVGFEVLAHRHEQLRRQHKERTP